MSDALEKIVVEAREEFRPKAVDWYAVDHGLFARVDADRRAARARATRERGQHWTAAAAALAAAGIVLVLVARSGHQRPTAQSDGDGTAATLLGIEGAGEVLVNGAHASLGAGLRRGDVVEARGATATFARPGHVTVVIEADARAVVARVEDPLVLTLDRGAVDAQVVPVPSGEAFAVDVDGARVAVHGTHLRVARSDGKVTVDLSEGVVSVGRAPRVGSVLGTLVTAPAHAEFTAADIRGTMTVTHDPSAVREPQTAFGPAAALPQVTPATNPAVPARLPVASASEAHPTVNAAPKPLPATPSAESVVEPPAAPSSAGPAPLPSSPTAVDPDAENTVAGAVRACISEHPRPDGMTVVVSTTLHLWLGGDGSVRSARFEPPVAPDVNTCAAAAIYRTRFPKSGSVKIPVDFSN
jgi:ferric-dicitrate binding protein FerR (iron transport regulator)